MERAGEGRSHARAKGAECLQGLVRDPTLLHEFESSDEAWREFLRLGNVNTYAQITNLRTGHITTYLTGHVPDLRVNLLEFGGG